MQLTPQKNEELKVDTSGRRSFVVALFGVSGAVVSALLAFPLVRFVTYPLRKSATATTWSDEGPVQDFASLTAPSRSRPFRVGRRRECATALRWSAAAPGSSMTTEWAHRRHRRSRLACLTRCQRRASTLRAGLLV
jgi:Rieske Fe-S protein